MCNPLSAITAAFTGQGQAASNARTANQAGLAQGANNFLSIINPGLTSGYNFAASQEAPFQNEITNAEQLLSPGNDQANLNQFSNEAYGNAANASRQADELDKGEGISDAYTAGQNTAINNEAATKVGQYQNQLDSPEYHLQQAQGLLGLMNQSANNPLQGDYNQLSGLVYGQPQVPVGEGFGQVLGSLAGTYLGGPGVGHADNTGDVTNNYASPAIASNENIPGTNLMSSGFPASSGTNLFGFNIPSNYTGGSTGTSTPAVGASTNEQGD
jgi:hypothetical protein